MNEILQILRPVIHYSLHFLLPGLIAWFFFKNKTRAGDENSKQSGIAAFFKDDWKRAWLIMIAVMLVDLDHLLAYPEVFVPDRCSIGFHPLHSYYAIAAYFVLAFFPKFRIVAVGLLIHMLTDFQDCLWIR